MTKKIVEIKAPAILRGATTRADWSIDLTLNFTEQFYPILAVLLDWRFEGLPIEAEITFRVKKEFREA